MSHSGPRILAVVAARGGSRRLPRKNVYPFFGEPMLAWTLRSCRGSEHIDDVVVTSEDAEILDIAAGLGCRLVQRPPELAVDDVPQIEVIRHAVDVIEKEHGLSPEIVVMVQGNSPELRPQDLDRAIEKLEARDLWEVLTLDDDLIHDGAFRVFRRHCLSNTFGAYTGGIITNYIDIHTVEDVKAAEARYGSVAAFKAARGS